MSYSPKDERRVHLEVDQSEHGMLNGDARAESPEAELDEVEQNLVRRYEDFSTVGECRVGRLPTCRLGFLLSIAHARLDPRCAA